MNNTADRLQRLSSEIMDLWVKRTLNEVKAANLQEPLALRNSLPIYLSQLVDALSSTIERTDARNEADIINSARISKKHGRERAIASGYTIDQLILEYHILRQVICDVMEREEILSPVELEVIICSIEQAVNDAATQFSETVREFQDQISHTLAHDLRNPLSTIKVSAQLLSNQLSQKDHRESLARILHGAVRMDDMIQELLEESRNRAMTKEFVLKEFDLGWLLRDVVQELNISNLDRFQIQSNEKCTGLWNENGLRRIIENLATNAIKYGNESSPVTLSLSQTSDEAILKVHNLGDPIPEEEIPVLFQKFKRGSTAKRKIGWGIGLTVVKSTVDALDGEIEVESDEIKGTTFTVRLPKKKGWKIVNE